MEKAVLLLWLLHLFDFQWLVCHWIPGLSILKSIPTIFTFLLLAYMFLSRGVSVGSKTVLAFLAVILMSSFFAENTGRARVLIRQMAVVYSLLILVLTYIQSETNIRTFFRIYHAYIAYMACWGLFAGGKVPWHYLLNEEDSFGPLMCIGASICFSSARAARPGNERRFLQSSALLSVAGVVASFARGAFVSLVLTMTLWVRGARKKWAALSSLAIAVATILLAARLIFPNNEYWEEMKTISHGTSQGTGHDRKVLWGVAWLEFIDHPLLGVGPYNFGVRAPEYIVRLEDAGHYTDPGRIWGRALHNGYFQVLSELGVFGVIAFLGILVDFLRSNTKGRVCVATTATDGEEGHRIAGFEAVSLLRGALFGMIALLLNLVFFDILYYGWLFDIYLLNAVVTRHLGVDSSAADSVPG
ncbi:MAG TPA: O-antigen ligase family protein [bacterium]